MSQPLPTPRKTRSKPRQAQPAPAPATQTQAVDFAVRRKRLGLTQQKLADAFGYTRQQIGAYENGRAGIPPIAMLAMAGLEDKTHHDGRIIGPFAVYDKDGAVLRERRAIYGIGDTVIEAVFEALDFGFGPLVMMNQRFALVRKMAVVEITPRLAKAVQDKGGDLDFVRQPDGRLDLPD